MRGLMRKKIIRYHNNRLDIQVIKDIENKGLLSKSSKKKKDIPLI